MRRRAVSGAVAILAVVVAFAPAARAASPPVAVPPPPTPAVVLNATAVAGSTAPVPSGAALRAQLLPLLASPALGGRGTLSVLDPATGTVLLDSSGTRPQLPASALKVLTAATALQALGPDARLRTTLVRGSTPGSVVLVGGGDATLTRIPTSTGTPAGQRMIYASLSVLADASAAALKAAKLRTVRLSFDDSLFTGPRTAPGWSPAFVAAGVVSGVDALSVDGGRTAANASSRSADPGLAAAKYFAGALSRHGIAVTGPLTRATAPRGAAALASVSSPTVADLVERALTESDNDLAEALGHLAGAAAGNGSFAGGAEAAEQLLDRLAIDRTGVVLADGSGLSSQDKVPAGVLARLLGAVASASTATASLWAVLTGLPVAGATGTLSDRFLAGADAGRGVVRAKTGTLTRVATLAGTVRDAGGRLIAFAVMTDSASNLDAARAQLDRIASAIAD